MPFTVSDFHDIVDADLWVLERMLSLPSDPPPTIGKSGSVHTLHIQSTFSMGDQQKAVGEYRRNLLPAMFIIAQKVYAEFFRIVIGNAGLTVGNKQVDIENKISQLISASSLNVSPPFSDYTEFIAWWSGQYNFNNFRKARNQIVHGSYIFNGIELSVEEKGGTILLNWKEAEVLEFCRSVQTKGQSI